MILVLAVNGLGEVLVAGLRQTVLLIQDVQDSDQLGLHQVWVAHRQHRQCRSSTVGGWGIEESSRGIALVLNISTKYLNRTSRESIEYLYIEYLSISIHRVSKTHPSGTDRPQALQNKMPIRFHCTKYISYYMLKGWFFGTKEKHQSYESPYLAMFFVSTCELSISRTFSRRGIPPSLTNNGQYLFAIS